MSGFIRSSFLLQYAKQGKIQCRLCSTIITLGLSASKRYSTLNAMNHVKDKHLEKSRCFCKHCPKTTSSLQVLKRHVITHGCKMKGNYFYDGDVRGHKLEILKLLYECFDYSTKCKASVNDKQFWCHFLQLRLFLQHSMLLSMYVLHALPFINVCITCAMILFCFTYNDSCKHCWRLFVKSNAFLNNKKCVSESKNSAKYLTFWLIEFFLYEKSMD